jgi:quinol monooxygenase YgiN
MQPHAILLILGLALGAGCASREARTIKDAHMPFVRIALLEIEPAQLDAYRAAVKEEMEASVDVEPGVLAIYAVAEKDAPTKLTFFEIYADEAAYHAHLATPHFRKYFETTKDMITSRRLIDTMPLQLSAKPQK